MVTGLAEIIRIRVAEENKKGVKLGNNLYKVRVASSGKGKRGSYRTIIVFKFKVRAIFIGGFAKNERENISVKQLSDYKELAKTYSIFSDEELDLLSRNPHILDHMLPRSYRMV